MTRFVLEKWRHEWFMGRIVQQEDEEDEEKEETIKVHVLGDPDAADKCFSRASSSLIPLRIRPSALSSQGVFPQIGHFVELLLVDEPLAELLEAKELTLVGQVVGLLPGRDVSIVQVAYPEGNERRVHIGNGFVSCFFYSPKTKLNH